MVSPPTNNEFCFAEDEHFDASQYAFFGGNVSQEIELGGLDEEDDIVFGGAFDEDDEKVEVHIIALDLDMLHGAEMFIFMVFSCSCLYRERLWMWCHR